MLAKRIIPCLDVKDGRTVKGVNFTDLKDAGDIVELSGRYSDEGADELVFLDITASHDRRKTMLEWVEQVAGAVNIPFTVGGGISSETDVEALLKRGADKISVNSSVLVTPGLIDRLAYHFGRQCIVVAIDAVMLTSVGRYIVREDGLLRAKNCMPGQKEAEERGAGEILFTSMDHDGTNQGFACSAIARLSGQAGIPIIARWGGKKGRFL